jgi:hypothetical protein
MYYVTRMSVIYALSAFRLRWCARDAHVIEKIRNACRIRYRISWRKALRWVWVTHVLGMRCGLLQCPVTIFSVCDVEFSIPVTQRVW